MIVALGWVINIGIDTTFKDLVIISWIGRSTFGSSGQVDIFTSYSISGRLR